ncbi:hypothetical protein KOW79_008731 [Hemibagrus wyckioides]|uniref:Uncharacterized protein n=1 Tax=Hemibagrus wyckioides TaxID=337641 RepID=A0A9D3SKN3_9TELE|nr:hypothetical protein KOW79_008731 [Hemibagrus wyckioides]
MALLTGDDADWLFVTRKKLQSRSCLKHTFTPELLLRYIAFPSVSDRLRVSAAAFNGASPRRISTPSSSSSSPPSPSFSRDHAGVTRDSEARLN